MPGSGETSPNPVFCAMPTQPDHTSAAAGAARTSSGQDRTVLMPEETAADRSRPAGPVVRAAGPATWSQICRGAGAVHARGQRGHGGHHPSCMASGCRSPVSAASAVATSWMVART